MKIQATIQLTNRDINVISKPMRGSMALGKRKRLCSSSENSSDPKVFLMFCTVSNRAGTKFEVCQNIASVHDKFLHLGECTIELIKPARTIFISDADPLQLKLMLNLLKKAINAKTDKELDALDAISLTSAALNKSKLNQIRRPKEKMFIYEKKDYPTIQGPCNYLLQECVCNYTITKNFPFRLKELKVNGINLKRIESRIVKLMWLVVLDLSGNSLTTWPKSFSGLVDLRELNLSNNQFSKVPVSFFLTVSKNLQLLDLSNNQLSMVPYVISRLARIATLNLSNNQLKRLPSTISSLTNLKILELVGNPNLSVMPGTFLKLELKHLSLSSRCLTLEGSATTIKEGTLKIPCLTDLCLVSLTKSGFRSKIDETCLPMGLLEYWDTMQNCSCGKLCLWSSNVRAMIKTNPRRIAQTFVTDGNLLGSETFIRYETLFCSTNCMEVYKNQPLNSNR